jgi:hypothetical protein
MPKVELVSNALLTMEGYGENPTAPLIEVVA